MANTVLVETSARHVHLTQADIEKLFFRKLVRDGIHVKIKSNRFIEEE